MKISDVKLRREAVAKLQNGFFCIYCNVEDNLVIDHLIPTAKGGTDNIENLVLACGKCNNKKLAWSDEDLRNLEYDYIVDKVIKIKKERLYLTPNKIKKLLATNIPNRSLIYNRLEQFTEATPLGNFIRELMYEKQLSQHALRKRIGCSGWFVPKTITGETHPSPKYLKKIAEALDEPIESFLKYIDVQRANNKLNSNLNKEIMYELWRQGKTITDVAKEINITSSTFSLWLQGSVVKFPFYLENLTLLAEVLGWSIEKTKAHFKLNLLAMPQKFDKQNSLTKNQMYQNLWKKKPEYKKNRKVFLKKVQKHYSYGNPLSNLKELASLMDISSGGIYKYIKRNADPKYIIPLFRILQISKISKIPYEVLPGEIFGQQQLEWQNSLIKIVKDRNMTILTLAIKISSRMKSTPSTFESYIYSKKNMPEPFIHEVCDFLDIPLPVLDMTDIEKELFDKNSI